MGEAVARESRFSGGDESGFRPQGVGPVPLR